MHDIALALKERRRDRFAFRLGGKTTEFLGLESRWHSCRAFLPTETRYAMNDRVFYRASRGSYTNVVIERDTSGSDGIGIHGRFRNGLIGVRIASAAPATKR